MPGLGLTLEIVNAVWTVMATGFLIYWVLYMKHHGHIAGRTFWQFLSEPPGVMQVAVALAVEHIGTTMIRGAVWVSRAPQVDSSMVMGWIGRVFLVTGIVIGTVGLLCQVRVISKPLYGNGPWIAIGSIAFATALAIVGWKA